jgi:DNA primase
LRIRLETGHFFCFACGVWGYLERARQQYGENRKGRLETVIPMGPRWPEPKAVGAALAQAWQSYQQALEGSAGEQYLARRGIGLELARLHGAGYAAAGTWLNRNRDCRQGRVVFPHTNPTGEVVNLYGRAVELDEPVEPTLRHDHLPGAKGYFGAAGMLATEEAEAEPLYVCEGALDALSLLAAGCQRTVAIFGVHGWRWDWARQEKALVFALDADAAGQKSWLTLGREAVLRGKQVWFLPPDSYGGCKDVNEAWQRGCLYL